MIHPRISASIHLFRYQLWTVEVRDGFVPGKESSQKPICRCSSALASIYMTLCILRCRSHHPRRRCRGLARAEMIQSPRQR